MSSPLFFVGDTLNHFEGALFLDLYATFTHDYRELRDGPGFGRHLADNQMQEGHNAL